jgi:Zn-dependent protease with chaperone function
MIKGRWHPKESAQSFDAVLIFLDDGSYRIDIEEGDSYQGEFSKLYISPRLGNVDRKITLEDGSVFISRENDTIDEVLQGTSRLHTLLHTVESHMGWVVVALVVAVVSLFSFFKWGIPWGSEKIAHALPYETNELIAGNTLKFLDEYMFDESNLTEPRQTQIRSHFQETLAPLHQSKKIVYKLHFRRWEDIPNALALPSGDIILTDKFVALCENQEQIDAVLLHEMGHVVHRHGLEMLIESTFISVAVMFIVGDVNGVADMGVGLGSLLVSSSYSREHESEADLYAFKQMLHLGIDPIAFTDIMGKMSRYIEDNNITSKGRKSEKEEGWSVSLSTHPETQLRMQRAKQYSECFKKGLKTCEIK